MARTGKRGGKMINLFDKWDQAARDFRLAQLIAQLKLPTVVIHDDGFLPRKVQSPLQYYCPRSDEGQPLYLDQIDRKSVV